MLVFHLAISVGVAIVFSVAAAAVISPLSHDIHSFSVPLISSITRTRCIFFGLPDDPTAGMTAELARSGEFISCGAHS